MYTIDHPYGTVTYTQTKSFRLDDFIVQTAIKLYKLDQKITAIMLIRREFGMSLLDSKTLLLELATRLPS